MSSPLVLMEINEKLDQLIKGQNALRKQVAALTKQAKEASNGNR